MANNEQEPSNIDKAQEVPPIIDAVKATHMGESDEQTHEQPAEDQDYFAEIDFDEAFKNIDQTDAEAAPRDDLEHDFAGAVIKHHVPGVDESDLNLVGALQREADLTDPQAGVSTSKPQISSELGLDYPNLHDDCEWDDDLDAEGEIDATWSLDHDDGVSNQSSTTLSSTVSITKRGYDELDSEADGDYAHSPHNNSPDPKRPRIV